ncbi:c-type cytochrome biogenesis protein CcsB [Microbacterium invictum]|uniref:Cytochrome c-type biogenesis protein CcsB n=1 Tax=Microbacterium invictum TaxID=515415 RepID=A0AA40VMP9_9MICO|nr:c-type cytochrome biogenesis protein CcsB [Microbacterium invictum]MBB4140654.1 cytochrome c-type biogenesis protein CcsB [Microbacterium invictum]
MFPETLSLDSVSVLLVWTAILIYALAFVAYSFDIAFRSSPQPVAARATVREPALVGAAAASAATGILGLEEAAASASSDSPKRARPMWARIGTSLTWLAFVFHLGATVLRGVAAERVPWSNMYEFALTGTLLITAVYLAVLIRYDLRFLGTFMVGLVVVLLGGSTLGYYVEVVPLMDPLKSVWLVIHVFVASLATAFFALAFAISVLQLLQARRERATARRAKAEKRPRTLRILLMIPGAETLETLAYRFVVIGFAFWTFTLIAGAIWAQESWGRYWGFDTKEVWTFIIWVVYAGYLHARATRGWRGTRSAWLAIVGFLTVLFNFSIVNVFFKGLHAYSGLS